MLRLQTDSAKAVDVFVERVAAQGTFWLLDDQDYIAFADSNNTPDTLVYPLFSDGALARRGNASWGNAFVPEEVPLAVLLERILPVWIEHGDKVGPNWDAHMAGAEVDPDALRARILAAQSSPA